MENDRDYITIKDDKGAEKEFTIEGLFEMNDKSYALLGGEDETILMRVEGDELVGISEEEREALLDAYEIAVEAEPGDIKH
jgi:uncharacterized protein YrzB (UPF0473 family)